MVTMERMNCSRSTTTLGAMPPRSVLNGLQPMGLGTPWVESLSSYFQRLADSHHVTPKILARDMVLPRLGFSKRTSSHQADRFWRSTFFNGMGEVPEKWVKVLEDLTKVQGLVRLTLLPLRGRVGIQGTSGQGRRWCPLCLKEGEPYGQLLWEIGTVTACPRHQVKLVQACTCTPKERVPYHQVKHLPTLCWACGWVLGERTPIDLTPVEEGEVLYAERVGALLASEAYGRMGILHDRSPALSDFLNRAVKDLAGGQSVQVAKALGFSKGAVSEWTRGHHLPSLPQALHIAWIFKAELSDVLWHEGRPDGPVHPKCHSYWGLRRSYPGTRSAFGLSTKLEAILEAEPPISVAEAARRNGTSKRELYRLYPEQAKAIAERLAKSKVEHSRAIREERLAVIGRLAGEMVAAGIKPTMKLLERRLVDIPRAFLLMERSACLLKIRNETMSDPPAA